MQTPELMLAGPANPDWNLILAHGAGQGMDSPFMDAFAEGLARRGEGLGGLRTVRFEFPYMERARREGKRRPPDREPILLNTWRTVITALLEKSCPRERLLIGGKSMGGRMATLIADEEKVAGVVCLGYPFHPPGKPDRLRTAHLRTMKTPTLICQGARDPFGSADDIPSYDLAETIRFCWLKDGEHSFKPRKASGLTMEDNWNIAMDAIVDFIRGKTE